MTDTTKIVFRQGVPTEPKVGEYRARSSSRGNEFDLSFDGKHWMLPCGTRHHPHSEYWYAGPLDIQFEQPLPVPKTGVAMGQDGIEYQWVDFGQNFCGGWRYIANCKKRGRLSYHNRGAFLADVPSLTDADLHPE